MYRRINKLSKVVIATILILSSSSLLVNTRNFSAQAQTNISSKWQEFTAKTGEFSVLLPGKPKESKESVGMDAGAGTLHTAYFK